MGKDILYGEAWTPGIGDPTFMGWFTVFAYLVASLLAFRRMSREHAVEMYNWRVWRHLGLILLFLAINKQLDLQSWFAHLGRQHALNHGWYDDRRLYQNAFIVTIVVLVPLFFVFYIQTLRDRWRDFLVSMIGMAFLLVFVLMRASAFHNTDILIGMTYFGIKLNWILELGGIAVIIFGIRYGDQSRKSADEIDEFGKNVSS